MRFVIPREGAEGNRLLLAILGANEVGQFFRAWFHGNGSASCLLLDKVDTYSHNPGPREPMDYCRVSANTEDSEGSRWREHSTTP